VLLHSETYATRQEAMSREWHLKRDRAFRRQLAAGIAGVE
jgi:putative endonuclease